MDRLSATVRCVTADMPGFGEAASIEGYTVQRMSEQVAALVEHFAPAPVILAGHSMSGKVSMVVAHTPPANLAGLALIAPSPLVPEPMEGNARAIMVRGNEDHVKADRFVLGGAHRTLSHADYLLAVEDVLRCNTSAWKAWPQSGTREDWSMDIQAITLPSVLIVGECDKAIPLAFQQEHTLPVLQDGELHVIENAGHLLPFEAPDELAVLLRRFVQELV